MHKPLLMVAPNGARRTKADHPELPITRDKLAKTAKACLKVGAVAIHLHVRDSAGRHSLDADTYLETTRAIRAAVGNEMIVQITTESAGIFGRQAQIACLKAVRPQSVSLALREIAPLERHEQDLHDLVVWMKENAVAPQFILYDADDVVRFETLRGKGVIPLRQPFLQLVVGRYVGNGIAHRDQLKPMVEAFDRENKCHWSVCAFGPHEADCIVAAAEVGGHARAGFENNIRLPNGAVAADNAELIAATASVLRQHGFDLMEIKVATHLLEQSLL